jgi:hypothetical protein
MAKVIEFYVPSIFRKPLKFSWDGNAERLSSSARKQANPAK